MTDARIPLTILTGFLGSGKTSLLKRFLSDTQSGRTAIIVNEYGETQIDGDLITFAGDTTAIRATTGCLCCTLSGDVKDALIELGEAQKAGSVAPLVQRVSPPLSVPLPSASYQTCQPRPRELDVAKSSVLPARLVGTCRM